VEVEEEEEEEDPVSCGVRELKTRDQHCLKSDRPALKPDTKLLSEATKSTRVYSLQACTRTRTS